MEPLNMPEPGEPISAGDFIRIINRAQALILYVSSLDLTPAIKAKLEEANNNLIDAMRRKIGS